MNIEGTNMTEHKTGKTIIKSIHPMRQLEVELYRGHDYYFVIFQDPGHNRVAESRGYSEFESALSKFNTVVSDVALEVHDIDGLRELVKSM